MRFGCCHNGGRLALRCGFSAPCEGTFLEYEKIPQSNTERGMIDMSDFELLSLVVMTANLIVQILIYIKKNIGITLFELNESGKISFIAIHAEDTFGDNNDLLIRIMILGNQSL